jgi:hypothetical protein
MMFKKGDKVTGKYLGRYPFEGTVWLAESKGQTLYVELVRPIFVGENVHPRNNIFVESSKSENEVKIMLDN